MGGMGGAGGKALSLGKPWIHEFAMFGSTAHESKWENPICFFLNDFFVTIESPLNH